MFGCGGLGSGVLFFGCSLWGCWCFIDCFLSRAGFWYLFWGGGGFGFVVVVDVVVYCLFLFCLLDEAFLVVLVVRCFCWLFCWFWCLLCSFGVAPCQWFCLDLTFLELDCQLWFFLSFKFQ